MIQDIHPHRFDIGFRRTKPEDGDYMIVRRGDGVLLSAEETGSGLPEYAALRSACSGADGHSVYLFSIDDRAFHYFPGQMDEPAGFRFQDAQAFRSYQPSWLAFAGITAWHLSSWYAHNRYCGACGGPMADRDNERALACGACGNTIYPRISPAVIVAVTDGDRLLLTRYANRPQRRMALVAGFMEVGETMEDTVRREVMEEVGIRVGNIRYYKSQPWAFSGSVLMGFYAELDGSPEITLDATELQEAVWVRREDIQPPDSTISLTSEMIEAFRISAVFP